MKTIYAEKSGPSVAKQIPVFVVLNARSAAKPDASAALYADLKSKNVDVCCITEIWLKGSHMDHLICPQGFTILRKDRKNRAGGDVAVLCKNDWTIQEIPLLCNEFECLWTKVKTSNSEFLVATVYHPPNPEYNQYDLTDILIDSVEKLLSINPNSKIIIAGDVNQLDIKMLINHLSLAQLVKSPTRGQRLLDVFLTNVLHFWTKTNVEKSLVRSYHNMVFVYPRDIVKADRRTTYFRDVRCQNRIKMMRELEHVNWNVINSNEKTSDEMLSKFYEVIYPLFEKFFPRIKVKLSTRDPPFMSPWSNTSLISGKKRSKSNRL